MSEEKLGIVGCMWEEKLLGDVWKSKKERHYGTVERVANKPK